MPERVLPMAQLRLYDPGAGDPVLVDSGFNWYAILRDCAGNGTWSVDADGVPQLEMVPEIGLVCRPFLVLADTRLSQYVTTGGSFDERRPMSAPRKYRLAQYDSTANLTWSATSAFSLPANPHFAFSLSMDDVPADQDTVTYPPLVRLEFGGRLWAIEFNRAAGLRLLRKVSGVWQVASAIGDGGAPLQDLSEKFVLVRCLRGRLCISTDWGKSYTYYANGDGSALSIASGAIALVGRGQSARFGLHQVKYYAGSFTSPPKPTFTVRAAPTATLSYRGAAPYGSGVAVASVSPLNSAVARFKVTLTPTPAVRVPMWFYHTPEVQAVQFEYPPVTAVPLDAGSYTSPADGQILEITVDEPYELDQGSASLTVRKEAAAQWDLDAWQGKWRKGEVYLGVLTDDGYTDSALVHTGYLRQTGPEQATYNKQGVSLVFDNGTIRAKEQEWDLFTRPYGGLTPNQALTKIVLSMGLSAGYCSWHADGDLITLPAGLAEDPFLWPQCGTKKWATMVDVARYAGCEIGWTRAGQFATVPIGYVAGSVSRVWAADPGADTTSRIARVSFGYDSTENVTCVIARGQDIAGNALWTYAVDRAAETDTTNARYAPWRETYIETVPGTVTMALLLRIAAALARQKLPPRYSAEFESEVDPSVLRRARVALVGTTLGIEDTDQFEVLSLKHRYLFDPSFSKVTTVAGLRRVAAV